MPASKPIKLPKTMAACADLLYSTRNQRLAVQKQVDNLQALETALKEHFIENLPKSQASGIAGKQARVQLEKKPIPVVKDWDKFYLYVRKNNAFDLLQRRLNEGAVVERRDAGKPVPGTGTFNAIKVSCTAL